MSSQYGALRNVLMPANAGCPPRTNVVIRRSCTDGAASRPTSSPRWVSARSRSSPISPSRSSMRVACRSRRSKDDWAGELSGSIGTSIVARRAGGRAPGSGPVPRSWTPTLLATQANYLSHAGGVRPRLASSCSWRWQTRRAHGGRSHATVRRRGSAGAPADEQVMCPQREPPFGKVLGAGQAAARELFDLPYAIAQRLLVDVQLRGGQLP